MNKILYFLMAGLFFTTFQVVEVEAQRGDPDRGAPDRGAPDRGDDGRATDRELDARYGTDRGAPDSVDTRDPRVREEVPIDPRSGDGVPRDTRVREEVEARDTPVEEDVETRGLSTKEMIQECKKTYGKKKKNKEAKLACIAAAKGQ